MIKALHGNHTWIEGLAIVFSSFSPARTHRAFLTLPLLLLFWLLTFCHPWLLWVASMYSYYIRLHSNQELFLSKASVYYICVVFLPLSAFHYTSVTFYHKLHPSNKVIILSQDSHFFLFLLLVTWHIRKTSGLLFRITTVKSRTQEQFLNRPYARFQISVSPVSCKHFCQ